MTQPTNGNGTWMQHRRAITNNARNMGIYCLGGRGSGKSWLLSSAIAWQDFLAHRPQVIFDPLGTTGNYFLSKLIRTLTYLPKAEHAKVWDRVVYCDMSGKLGFVTPFPFYYRLKNDTLQEMSERLLTVILQSNPGLVSAPVSWPSMHQLGVQAGTLLASLGLQVTELRDLLFNTTEWEKRGLFAEALRRYPEDASPAVSYFRNTYLPLSRTDKSRLVSTLFDHVFQFTSDKNLRAVFAASVPGIRWETVAANGQTVLLDFRGISTPETKRFALLWTFSHLYEFIKQRTRSDPPFGIVIDEFAAFATKVESGTNPLAMLFDEFLQQYMRNSNIWLTIAHQSIQQLDEQLRNTVLSLGNYLFAQVPTMEAARILADAVFFRDPYRVKYWRPVYGRILPRGADIPEEPEFMPLEEQRELFAQQLRKLPAQQFLLRPAEREGVISTAVYPISIRGVDLDPVTNEYHYPDQKLLDTLFPKLAAKDGIPIQEILREQETRLTQDITQHLPGQTRTEPLPAEEERQIATLPQDGHPTQEKTRTDPSRRTLDEDQRTFLTFLMANPETPVSALPKELRISAAQGTMIRENLKQHGLIEELDVRTGRIGAGRPTKFVIPTLQAFELMGHEPPQGRGGVVHRALQHAVSEGALAKGYNTKVEYRLPTGAIVDVHLEKWQERIAVEIAVLSKPSREIAHIKQSLEAHYDKIYAVFADTHLLERTSEALAGELTDAERAKIQLLPVSKLTSVG